MSKLILYGLDASPPVRAVLLTLKALELPFDYVEINLFDGEHKTADYLAKNPAHTVPMLEDEGNFISDSHAIMGYLVGQHGKDDSLYPKDTLLRALVDQRLHFDTGTMFNGGLIPITRPLLFMNETMVPQFKIDTVAEAYNMVETFLGAHSYVAGDQLTIADFSFVATLSSLAAILEIDEFKYGKLTAWLERMKQLPYYEEANGKGAGQFNALIKSKNMIIVQ